MPRSIAIARMIFLIVSASYLLSAGLLALARSRGESVAGWVITAWLIAGAVGFAVSFALAPDRRAIIVALVIVLGPWMIYSLIGDVRGGHWIIAIADVAALGAIAYAAAIGWH